MASSPTSVEIVRFGEFEANLRSRELRRKAVVVRLPEQSFAVLVMLLERPGELIPREDIRKRLWSSDTFVDFDHGLNNAVNRLRGALEDSADAPRWIETLPRRGYRFIGNVDGNSEVPDTTPKESHSDNHPAAQPPEPKTPWRIRYRLAAMVAALGVVLAFILFWRVGPAKHPVIHSLAVLPLENLSGDQGQDYFADGMTDELITMLAKNPGLRVISRTSTRQYKNAHRPIREIARELGVDAILEGSVNRYSNRVHINAQLIHADSDTHLWAESYDRDLSDVSSVQRDLAETIARQVGVTASASSPSRPEKRINPEAHDAYLLGRYYWFLGNTDKSKQSFQRAIDLQPDYAAAWSGLADTYLVSGVSGEAPAETVMPTGEADALKAVQLDDSSPEAHDSLAAAYYFYRWDWQAAERESARAIELNPGLAEAHHLRSYVLFTLNRTDEAVAEQRKATALDPFARPWALPSALIRAHQYGAALEEGLMRSKAQPTDPTLHAVLMSAYVLNGMEKEAAQEWETTLRLKKQEESALAVHNAFQQGGFKAALEWDLQNLKQIAAKEYVPPLQFAYDYARLGRKDEALRYLELAYKEHQPFLVHLQSDPDVDVLHSDPRYQQIVKKMRLPAK